MIIEIAFVVIFVSYIGAAFVHVSVLEERHRKNMWKYKC